MSQSNTKLSMCWIALILSVLALLPVGAALADSWGQPETKTYISKDRSTRFTAEPRILKDQLSYFNDKVAGIEPAGQQPGSPSEARGKLERRIGADWKVVWERTLVNEVAPVSALVSTGGEWVVTFDNWYSEGWGNDVVVIYGKDGVIVRKFGLSDILPSDYVEALPRSISSIEWAGDRRISGKVLMLKIVVPGNEDRRRYVDVRIDLATGQIQRPSGATWVAALAAAAKAREAQAAERADGLAELKRPLSAPSTSEEFEWLRYLYEAFRRVAPDWKGEPPETLVLPLQSDKDYAFALDLFVGILEEGETANGSLNFIAASPDEANMTAVLIDASPRLANNRLKGKRLYLVVGDKNWTALHAALQSTGVELIQIDPS